MRVLPVEEVEPQPLVFHHMPIAASLGFFRTAEGSAPITVLDPSDREELVRRRAGGSGHGGGGVVVAAVVVAAVEEACGCCRRSIAVAW